MLRKLCGELRSIIWSGAVPSGFCVLWPQMLRRVQPVIRRFSMTFGAKTEDSSELPRVFPNPVYD